jgi:hypothetical protein
MHEPIHIDAKTNINIVTEPITELVLNLIILALLSSSLYSLPYFNVAGIFSLHTINTQ